MYCSPLRPMCVYLSAILILYTALLCVDNSVALVWDVCCTFNIDFLLCILPIQQLPGK